MRTAGRVFADHYHSHVLETPTELVNALAYVLGNAEHHYRTRLRDPFSSGAYDPERRHLVLSDPQTWLVRVGWRRARSVPHWLQRR